jgi:hypothetical protein
MLSDKKIFRKLADIFMNLLGQFYSLLRYCNHSISYLQYVACEHKMIIELF